MKPCSVWKSLVVILMLFGNATGQRQASSFVGPRGKLTGFDGKAAAAVLLNSFNVHGKFLEDVKSRADGRYAFRRSKEVVTVKAWLEGVELSLPVDKKNMKSADFNFAKATYFTVQGTVLSRLGKPLARIKIHVRNAKQHWLATMHSDAMGKFRVRVNREVASLLAEPSGYQVLENGPWATDATVTIDYQELEFFLLAGRVIDENNRAVSACKIAAYDMKGRQIHSVKTDAKGAYRLWINRTAKSCWATVAGFALQQRGRWNISSEISFDYRKMGVLILEGSVLDAKGRPLANVGLYPSGPKDITMHVEELGRTNAEGKFRIRILKTQVKNIATWINNKLLVCQGPWEKDSTVVLRAR